MYLVFTNCTKPHFSFDMSVHLSVNQLSISLSYKIESKKKVFDISALYVVVYSLKVKFKYDEYFYS